MIGISHDDVVENVDFEKLACSDEITGDFDVRLRWSRITAYAACGISGEAQPSDADGCDGIGQVNEARYRAGNH